MNGYPQLSYVLNLKRPIVDQLVLGMTLSNFAAGPLLRLYVILLPYGVFQVWLLRRHAYLALAIVVQIYVFSQCFPEFNLKNIIPQHCHWYVSVLAWQLLYFIGLAFGSKSVCVPGQRVTRGMMAFAASVILLVSFLVVKSSELPTFSVVTEAASELRRWPEATEKMTLGPLRILHFVCLAYLVSLLAVRFPRFAIAPLAAPIVLVGQHPLLMYCSGVFLSYASLAIRPWLGVDIYSMLLLHLDLVLLSIVIAGVARWRSGRGTVDPLSPSLVPLESKIEDVRDPKECE